MHRLSVLLFLFFVTYTFGQEPQKTVIKGRVASEELGVLLEGVMVSIEGSDSVMGTDADGGFELSVSGTGERLISLRLREYLTQNIPIQLDTGTLDMGMLYLKRDITYEQTDNLISLTATELVDEEISAVSVPLLQGTRDVFLTTAAFDFGQAFFRVRGYDSQNAKVLINGIPMNRPINGRPQWNHWGGLNDVMRNQEFTHGLGLANGSFGGVLGTTAINTRPTSFRSGTRLSSSFSDRTYAGRLMATHTASTDRIAYSVSGSRRWAPEGYIEGTLYDAFSFFGTVEYALNKNNSMQLTGIFAPNRRGRSAAITQEVFELVGRRYNPYWGLQNEKTRNSRERRSMEPIVMLNHYYSTKKFQLRVGAAYQFGEQASGRLGYYNAPNPDPTYYRYLPSYYTNSTIGANFESANQAAQGFISDPQMDWPQIYAVNTAPDAAYVQYDDRTDDRRLLGNITGNWQVHDNFKMEFGGNYQQLTSENFAEITDLLGAEYHNDIDVFSNTRNDIGSALQKREGDRFGYHYKYDVSLAEGFVQFQYQKKKWNAFLSGRGSENSYTRNGLFQNERFPENSLGESNTVGFLDYAVKSGLEYQLTGRHWITGHASYGTEPPALQHSFVNPRENNLTVEGLSSSRVTSADLNYVMRLPKLTARLSGFYTRFQNTTDINFFFVDSGVGSDFVQEVVTGLDKLHKGVELGIAYKASSSVRLTGVMALGEYTYANNPRVAINFDTAGPDEELINQEGYSDLGTANLKGYRLSQGPQKAFSIGVEYRDPAYWWVKTTANFLADNHVGISTITRTQSFLLNPDTGEAYPEAIPTEVAALLTQERLPDFYLLNLVGGKSWLKKGKYASVFLSINNVFDTVYKTGGYEQSRNGNFGQLRQDNLSGNPSFGPRYWFGYGRTYFLNLAFSF
ncbi:TonB-dependent receptor [Maribacter sp. 2-571]|uniref:TonB-dependent receptor n=1 Tax=Maribacter sp. 2-571 TaxID=3417569 RepID=UPI003D344601